MSPAVPNEGNGEPKAFTGMVGTHHRPSDDISIYAFLTSANAMLSVELTHLANMLDAVHQRQDVSSKARQLSKRISDAVWGTTVRHTSLGNVSLLTSIGSWLITFLHMKPMVGFISGMRSGICLY